MWRMAILGVALLLVGCGNDGTSTGDDDAGPIGDTGVDTGPIGDTTIPVPDGAPTCRETDGNIIVRVTGEVDGEPVTIGWSATGTVSRGGGTSYSLGRYPRYEYPDASFFLRWEGPSDFEGALPARGQVSPGEGSSVDVGNCELESLVWRIDTESYVFQLTDLRHRGDGSSPYCDGTAADGTLLGCLIDRF